MSQTTMSAVQACIINSAASALLAAFTSYPEMSVHFDTRRRIDSSSSTISTRAAGRGAVPCDSGTGCCPYISPAEVAGVMPSSLQVRILQKNRAGKLSVRSDAIRFRLRAALGLQDRGGHEQHP